jgi:hypothetical protein
MKYGVAASVVVVALCFYSAADEPSPLSVDDERLSSFLDWCVPKPWADGSHMVICPVTNGLFAKRAKTPSELDRYKKWILKEMFVEGYDLGPLLDTLVERNKRTVRIKLAPAIAGRFVLDEGEKFPSYFREDGGGWEKWYKDNAKARGYCTVSLPAVDDERGFVMVYVSWMNDEQLGQGTLYLFHREGEKLKRVAYCAIWMT